MTTGGAVTRRPAGLLMRVRPTLSIENLSHPKEKRKVGWVCMLCKGTWRTFATALWIAFINRGGDIFAGPPVMWRPLRHKYRSQFTNLFCRILHALRSVWRYAGPTVPESSCQKTIYPPRLMGAVPEGGGRWKFWKEWCAWYPARSWAMKLCWVCRFVEKESMGVSFLRGRGGINDWSSPSQFWCWCLVAIS